MQTHPLKLITIVAESTLEHRLTEALRDLGATGFTVLEGRGEGSRGLHAAEIPGSVVRVEAVVAPAVADRVIAHLAERYFADYSIIAYVTDVAVVRSHKYVRAAGAGATC